MSPDDGNTSALYAGSYDNGDSGSPDTNRGSSVRPFTPSKPGDGLRAFAGDASVMMESPAGNALTAVASTLLNAKTVRLESASLTPKQVHAFCDHVELLIRAPRSWRSACTL